MNRRRIDPSRAAGVALGGFCGAVPEPGRKTCSRRGAERINVKDGVCAVPCGSEASCIEYRRYGPNADARCFSGSVIYGTCRLGLTRERHLAAARGREEAGLEHTCRDCDSPVRVEGARCASCAWWAALRAEARGEKIPEDGPDGGVGQF